MWVESDFKWFKCQKCNKKITNKNNDTKMLMTSAYQFKDKVCKECVVKFCVELGITNKELTQARKQKLMDILENGNEKK